MDVTREADVIEEILRIYGYNFIEIPAKVYSSIAATEKPDPEKERINRSKKEFGGKLVTQYNYKRVDSSVYKLLKAGYKMVSSLRK